MIYVYIGPAGCIGLSGVLVWECGECPNQYRLVKEPLGPDGTERRPTGGGQYTERAGRLGPTGPAPSQEEEDGAPGMALKWKFGHLTSFLDETCNVWFWNQKFFAEDWTVFKDQQTII